MAYSEFMIYGDVNVRVRVTDLGDGAFQFDVDVVTEGADYTGQIGELNGFWFNLPDGIDYGQLSVTGVEDYQLAADDVNKLDGGVNLSGTVLKENGGEFDAGMLIDQTGLAGEEGTVSASFVLTDASGSLTLEDFTTDFADQYFGVRLTSVGDPDGSRDGSLKLGGDPDSSDDIVPDDDPENPDDGGDDEPPAPENVANDDFLYVSADERFGDGDSLDIVDPLNQPSGLTYASVLGNDTSDGFDYEGLVTSETGIILEGSAGGYMIINPDGTLDFSAEGMSVNALTGPVLTEFNYEIEGGDMATIHVYVSDDSGPEGPF